MTYAITNLRAFAEEHDSLPAFHAAYLVLTILVAAMFNLGVFALLVMVHMSLDIVKYRDIHGFNWRQTAKAVFHESLIDITLITVALVFSVYLHHSVALVSVSGLIRAEVTIVRAFGTLIPKVVILENFLKVISHFHHYLLQVHPGAVSRGWSPTDRLYMSFIAVSLLLLFLAPQFTGASPSIIRLVVFWEMTPWNI